MLWAGDRNISLKVFYSPIVIVCFLHNINTYNLTQYHVNQRVKPQVLKLIYGSPLNRNIANLKLCLSLRFRLTVILKKLLFKLLTQTVNQPFVVMFQKVAVFCIGCVQLLLDNVRASER